MNDRTRLSRVLGALLALLLIVGFSASPSAAAATPLAGIGDDVRAALAADGTAQVIVRLRDQADLTAVAREAERVADEAAAAEVAGTDALTGLAGSVDGLADGLVGDLTDLLPASLAAGVDDIVVDIGDDLVRTVRVATVVDALRQATADAGEIASLLRSREATGQVRDLRSFWIFNGFAATIDAETLEALGAHPDVASVVLDEVIELGDASPSLLAPGLVSDVTALAGHGLLATGQQQSWGITQVGAPEAWHRYQTRGAGVVVGIMDSGVDASHPALAASWRGTAGDPAKSWYVPTGERYPTPGDGRGHGTHVAGTIVGEAPGDTTGVAPDAQWIAAKIFRDSGTTTASIIHAGFQWMLAPGGDPSAAPDVVNNSWGTSSRNATEFWHDIEAWIAAGIVPVFAVGNRGPGSGSLSSPASFPHAIAVGATDGYDRVAGFSSRGPVSWYGTRHHKPDLTAPGYRIRSAWPRQVGGGYRLMTGTSMAAPHVAGAAALIRSVYPDLPVADVRAALERSARGGAGSQPLPNNSYGHGIVDAPAALRQLAR